MARAQQAKINWLTFAIFSPQSARPCLVQCVLVERAEKRGGKWYLEVEEPQAVASEKRQQVNKTVSTAEGHWPTVNTSCRREGRPPPETQVQQGCSKLETGRTLETTERAGPTGEEDGLSCVASERDRQLQRRPEPSAGPPCRPPPRATAPALPSAPPPSREEEVPLEKVPLVAPEGAWPPGAPRP